MYADAGDQTRTYRVTVQDGPTTPQRHTFKKARITTIYNTNRFTSSDKEEKFVASANKEDSSKDLWRRHRGSNPDLPGDSSRRSHDATATYI